MAAYIAMLRGVNVSGHNTINMEVLRGLCEGLGFRNVDTYIQSGNLVFQSATENPAIFSKRIGEAILQSFGFDTPVIVRTSKEMRNVIANNPFLREESFRSYSSTSNPQFYVRSAKFSNSKAGGPLPV